MASIEIDGEDYASIEHYYQYQKFTGVDNEYAEKFRNAKSPMEARRLANANTGKYKKNLFEINEGIMEKACFAKFTQNDDLKELLLSTGYAKLQEGSKTDKFWGIGEDGSGRNTLGEILMRVRDKIRPKSELMKIM